HPRFRRNARGDGPLFRRLAAGEHDVVRQPAQFSGRPGRDRHDRGPAERHEMTGPAAQMHTVPPLPKNLRHILDAEYPRFSAAEMARRRSAIEDAMAEADIAHLVYCGLNRTGSAVQWLTQWPITAEAVGVLSA